MLDISMVRRHDLLVFLAAALTACGAEPAPPATGADATSAEEIDAGGACPPQQPRPGGGCCPTGHVDHEGECHPVGPRGCEATVFGAVAECALGWCWDWRDTEGRECRAGAPSCLPEGRTCEEGEEGCPTGTWPGGEGGACVAPGDSRTLALGDPDALPELVVPTWGDEGCEPGSWPLRPGICVPAGGDSPAERPRYDPRDPAPPATPAPAARRWCLDELGGRACGPDETGCAPGELPFGDACHPAPGPGGCPLGFVPDRDGCEPDPDDCEGPVPEGALVVGEGGFATLAEALEVAGDGDTIWLEAGTWEEPLELDLGAGSLDVVGRCAALVELAPGPTRGILALSGSAYVRGVTVREAVVGVEVREGALLDLERVWVRSAQTKGVIANGGGAEASLVDVVVEDTRPDPSGDLGAGVQAVNGAALSLTRVRVSGAYLYGVVAGPGTCEVGEPDGARIEALGLRVDDVAPAQRFGTGGLGAHTCDGAQLVLHGASVRDVHVAGLSAYGPESRLEAVGVSVSKVLIADDEIYDAFSGVGVRLGTDAEGDLVAVEITGSAQDGISVRGASARLRGVSLSDLAGYPGSFGGLSGSAGAVIDAEDLSLRGVGRRGINLDESEMFGRGVLVAGTWSDGSVTGEGSGAGVVAGGRLTLVGSRLTDNGAAGVFCQDSGSLVQLTGVLVDATRPHPVQRTGVGVEATFGGRAEVRGSWLHGNAYANMLVGRADEGRSSGLVERTLVTRAVVETPFGQLVGHALAVAEGILVLRESQLAWSTSSALYVVEGAHVDVRDALIAHTADVPIYGRGAGIAVADASTGDIVATRVHGSHTSGVVIGGESADGLGGAPRVRLVGALLDGCAMPVNEVERYSSSGLEVSFGGRGSVFGSRLYANELIGANVLGEQTLARLAGVLIDGTEAVGARQYGVGLTVSVGAQLECLSCRIDTNRSAGLAVFEASSATLVDSVISNVLPASFDALRLTEEIGDGAMGLGCASLSLERSLVRTTHRAGVLLQSCDAFSLQGSAIAGAGLWGLAVKGTPPSPGPWAVFDSGERDQIGEFEVGVLAPPE